MGRAKRVSWGGGAGAGPAKGGGGRGRGGWEIPAGGAGVQGGSSPRSPLEPRGRPRPGLAAESDPAGVWSSSRTPERHPERPCRAPIGSARRSCENPAMSRHLPALVHVHLVSLSACK